MYRYTYQFNTLNLLSLLHWSGPTYSSYRVHEPGRKQEDQGQQEIKPSTVDM
jgi:hypothetical protein